MIGSPLTRIPVGLASLLAATGVTAGALAFSTGMGMVSGGHLELADVDPIEVVVNADPAAADGEDGSLRWAVAQAAESGVPAAVQLGSANYVLDAGCTGITESAKKDDDSDLAVDARVGDLDSGEGDADLVLMGSGATVSAKCAKSRVFEHHGTGTLKLDGVTLSEGKALGPFGQGRGGAILSEKGAKIVVVDSVLSTNTAASSGGAIYAAGEGTEVVLRESTLMGNTAEGSGGGGAAVLGDLRVVNSTIANNKAQTHGAVTSDVVELLFATVTNNSATKGVDGSQVGAYELVSAGSVIVDGVGSIETCDVERVESRGYNVGDDTSCGFDEATRDVVATSPTRLAALSTYDGRTFARPPLEGSLLRDAIPPASCLKLGRRDQLGASRPSGAGCEIGAVEITPGLDLSGGTPAPSAVAATAAVAATYTG